MVEYPCANPTPGRKGGGLVLLPIDIRHIEGFLFAVVGTESNYGDPTSGQPVLMQNHLAVNIYDHLPGVAGGKFASSDGLLRVMIHIDIRK